MKQDRSPYTLTEQVCDHASRATRHSDFAGTLSSIRDDTIHGSGYYAALSGSSRNGILGVIRDLNNSIKGST